MAWTKFTDLHSGGGRKEDYDVIFIEAPQMKAELIFYNRFGHDPGRVSCSCCGSDYSVCEVEPLDEELAQLKSRKFLIIPESDIEPSERMGSIPQSGWVWMGE